MDDDDETRVPTPEQRADADRHFWNWIASYDPELMAEAMAFHGSLWTEAHYSNATLRCLALADHEPDDGTPEGEELAAIYARKEEYEEVLFGSDEEAG